MNTPESGSTASPTAFEPTAGVPEAAKPLLHGPKRQHYLPRFYLHEFASDGFVAVYDRETGLVRRQQPINTGVEGHFYTLTDDEGRKRFELEKLLEQAETKAKPVIGRLAAGENINAQERDALASFIGLGARRTPESVQTTQAFASAFAEKVASMLFSDADRVEQMLRDPDPQRPPMGGDPRAVAEQIAELARIGGLKAKTDEKWALTLSMEAALELGPLLAARDWTVLRAPPRKSFVTSDAPVLLRSMDPERGRYRGTGFATPDAVVVFPLTATCALLMVDAGGRLHHADVLPEGMRRFNLDLAANCRRYLIGRDEALVKSLAVELRLSCTQWTPRVRVN